MLPRTSPKLLLATAGGLVAVHSCIMLGGALREAAVAFCAFALLVGAPIAILAWFGSVSDLGDKTRKRHRDLKKQKSDALLWQATLAELQQPALAGNAPANLIPPPASVASPPKPTRRRTHSAGRAATLFAAAASTLGLMGCDHYDYFYGPPSPWALVQPGMGTAEVVSLIGAPQQIKSDGMQDVWQYCRDLFGRNARYYMAVLIEREQVQAVRPYPVGSNAGCQDFYRSGF